MHLTTAIPSLTLSALQTEDAEELFALTERNRPYLKQWLPWLDQTTEMAHTQAFIIGLKRRYEETGAFACALRYHGTIVGVAGHNVLDTTNAISYIGYWLSADAQGQGLMTASVRALIEHAFDHLRINRIDIRVATENIPSQRVCQRLGFSQEGVLRDAEWLYDHYVDHTINSLLRRDPWNQPDPKVSPTKN
jgi:ribosomal-protein-serine acetyltransferase